MKASNRGKRREYWQAMIKQQEQSGLTVQAFCAEQGITEGSFYNWRKQLRGSAPVSFALVEARPGGIRPKMAVEVVMANGERVQVAPGTDAATLRMILAVLRERA